MVTVDDGLFHVNQGRGRSSPRSTWPGQELTSVQSGRDWRLAESLWEEPFLQTVWGMWTHHKSIFTLWASQFQTWSLPVRGPEDRKWIHTRLPPGRCLRCNSLHTEREEQEERSQRRKRNRQGTDGRKGKKDERNETQNVKKKIKKDEQKVNRKDEKRKREQRREQKEKECEKSSLKHLKSQFTSWD